MPVYDYRRMNMKGLPDQICVVLKPVGTPSGQGSEHQSGEITLESIQGTVGYLPVFMNYQDALAAYPNVPIYVMDLTAYKEEMGFIPPMDKPI